MFPDFFSITYTYGNEGSDDILGVDLKREGNWFGSKYTRSESIYSSLKLVPTKAKLVWFAVRRLSLVELKFFLISSSDYSYLAMCSFCIPIKSIPVITENKCMNLGSLYAIYIINYGFILHISNMFLN